MGQVERARNAWDNRVSSDSLPAVRVPHGRLDEGRVAVEGEEAGDFLGGEGAPVVLDGRRLAREPLGQEPTEPRKSEFKECQMIQGVR